MEKLNITVNDLNTFISAISIAVNLLGQQASAIMLGCQENGLIYDFFKKYNITDYKEQEKILRERFNELIFVYNQLLEIEKRNK